jgi:regulator of sirC expression with transglutaminase-like and TPR domain
MDRTVCEAMSDAPRPRQALEALLTLPDEAIDLAQAALLIARDEYPDLQVGHYLTVLDRMAEEMRARMRGGEGPTSLIAHLNRYLFDDLGFRGNLADYDDPRNSYLNDVLDRRVGIPISLSAIYMEVGRRCGIPLAGVSFPGHFLVRYAGSASPDELLIDPFHRGALLTPAECGRRLEEQFGGRIPFRPEMLRRARNREILERMLNNLRRLFVGSRDFHRALRVQHRLVCLRPDSAAHLRDSGILHYRVALFAQAAADLERSLELSPGDAESEGLRRQIERLRLLTPVMN